MKFLSKKFLGLLFAAFAVGASLPVLAPGFYSSLGLCSLQNSSFCNSSEVPQGNFSLYFCPYDRCSQKLISFYGSAKKSIHVMIYSFTMQEIADALIDAKSRGVDVKVLIDNSQAALKDSKDEYLIENGIELKRVDLSGYHIFHNKVSIVDSSSFSTGSFNYTLNADTGSAENLLIVEDEKLASAFEAEFQRYWESS